MRIVTWHKRIGNVRDIYYEWYSALIDMETLPSIGKNPPTLLVSVDSKEQGVLGGARASSTSAETPRARKIRA